MYLIDIKFNQYKYIQSLFDYQIKILYISNNVFFYVYYISIYFIYFIIFIYFFNFFIIKLICHYIQLGY